MKSYTAFPVFKTIPESYHLESPVVSGNRFLWVQIHGTPEAGSPGLVHWFDLPEDGFSEDGLAKTILNEGAVGFIQKPYQPNALLSKVRSVLDADG